MGSHATAPVFALAMLASCGAAMADDWPDHDIRIEKWAAQKVSARLGELRGPFGHRANIGAVTVHPAFDKPKPRPRPPTRIFVIPRIGESLPPLVLNEVPPGVDPIITGANDRPTGAASRHAAREAMPKPLFPARTSLLLD